jgi:hypothetical protein
MYWLANVLLILIFIMFFVALITPWVIGSEADSVGGKVVGFVVSAVVLWACVWGLVSAHAANLRSTQEIVTIKVNKAERVGDGNKSSKYLIFTDKGVFENTDEWYYGKFDSSDLYNEIQAGKSYTCTTVGWRIEFWSSYRNIINCKATS